MANIKNVTKEQLREKAIDLSVFPSAGPSAYIEGWCQQFWEKDAFVIKHDRYVYRVTQEVYDLF